MMKLAVLQQVENSYMLSYIALQEWSTGTSMLPGESWGEATAIGWWKSDNNSSVLPHSEVECYSTDLDAFAQMHVRVDQ